MKKKLFLVFSIMAMLACLLAISVSANAIYKDEEGNILLELEFYTTDDGVDTAYTGRKVVKSYEGGFDLVDESGNCLTWYITDSTNYVDGDVEHTVACFKTVGEADSAAVRGVISNGKYSYVGVDAKKIVSANFPDDQGIKSFGFSYGGYNQYSNTNLLFFYAPKTLTTMDEGIFQDAPVLVAELDEDADMTALGKKICYNARNLRRFTIPSKVTKLQGVSESQGTTFYNCVSLEEVVFGENSQLASTGNYDFWNCYKLSKFALPNNGIDITIGVGVFINCKSLGDGVVSDCVVSIGANAFENSGLSGSLFSASSRCTSIGIKCFKNTNITSLTVLDAFTTIPQEAFSGCDSLESVTFGASSSLVSIGQNAFSGCSSVTSFEIPSGVQTIGNSAFYGCASATVLTLPDNLESIGESSFEGTGMTSLRLPAKVTVIPKLAFKNCSKIASVEICGNVVSIGDSGFNGCSSLTEIVLPDTVASLGDSCFSGCSQIKAFTVPAGVTVLSSRLLSGCSSLESIEIHNNVTTVGVRVFQGCKKLTSVNFGAGLTTLLSESDHHSLTYQAGVKEVYLPASFTADSLPSSGRLTYIFTNGSTVFYYAGTQEQFDGIVAKLKGVEGNGAFSTTPTVENGRLVLITACQGFYNNKHTGAEEVEYAEGFDKNGSYTVNCTRCSQTVTEELAPIITSLGYATGDYFEGRLLVTSGYSVDAELVELYKSVTGVTMEIGVLFAKPTQLAQSPTTLDGITYFSDEGSNAYKSYNFIVSFPAIDTEEYEKYVGFEFVVSSFIRAGDSYSYYQTDLGAVTTLESGFTTTTLEAMLGTIQ